MPVSIIGTRGSGKSTFMALLYQTMGYYTNDPATKDMLKYYCRPEVSMRLQEEILQMMQGYYPQAGNFDTMDTNRFLIGFKPRGLEKLLSRTKEAIIEGGEFEDFLCLLMEIYNMAGEDIERYSRNPESSPLVKRMFDSNVVIFIVDASNFTGDSEGPKAKNQMEHDKDFSAILSSFIEYRVRNKSGNSRGGAFYPIIVLTKVDNLEERLVAHHGLDRLLKFKAGEIDVDAFLGELQAHTPGKKSKDLWKLANNISVDLMRAHMPATSAVLNGSELMGVKMHEAQYFLSWTSNKRDGETIRPRTDRLSYSNHVTYQSPIYSRHMYVALLDYLREIVEKSPDNESLFQGLFGSGKGRDSD